MVISQRIASVSVIGTPLIPGSVTTFRTQFHYEGNSIFHAFIFLFKNELWDVFCFVDDSAGCGRQTGDC
jgi:hypothetical protein